MSQKYGAWDEATNIMGNWYQQHIKELLYATIVYSCISQTSEELPV